MELKFDTSKIYAIALEGGGAKGAYEVGVWKALEEAGVRYNAVAGTSVGALNGAMMTMHELEKAICLWKNITFSRVFDADDERMRRLYHGELQGLELRDFLKDCITMVKEGGLDIEPLRNLLEEQVDEEKIRSSDVKFFLVTYSLTDKKELDIEAGTLEKGKLRDMLLASAYVPLFRRKKLDGKDYVDGSVQNIVPINCLLERGYRDIIVIRIYGVGIEKRTKIPKDANVITVAPKEKLGGVLQFDAEQTQKDMKLGYFDGQRMLYGLAGERYYIDAQWDEMRAYVMLRTLVERFLTKKMPSIREINEKLLPKLAKRLKQKEGQYHDLLICFLEQAAEESGLDPFRIRTEEALLNEILAQPKHRKEIWKWL